MSCVENIRSVDKKHDVLQEISYVLFPKKIFYASQWPAMLHINLLKIYFFIVS